MSGCQGARRLSSLVACLAAGLVVVFALLGFAFTRAAAAAVVQGVAQPAVGTTAAAVPVGQTYGGSSYGVNPTAVDDSVNSGDGALEISHTDLRVAGIAMPFVLTRQFNSNAVGVTGAFGPGWSSILDLGIVFSSSGSRAVIHGEDGQQAGFTYQTSSKTWLRDPGVRASLTCSGPATNNVAPTSCTVKRFSDGASWTLAKGLVQNFLTAGGQGLKFSYTGSLITKVTVETTRATPLVITITRNASGRVTKIATPTRSVSYTYSSAGDLATVTEPAGDSWRMTYSATHLLQTEIAYASASATSGEEVVKATYQSGGRVSAVVVHNGSELHDATFGWAPSTPAGSGTLTRGDAVDVSGTVERVYSLDTYSKGVLVGRTTPMGYATANTYNADLDLTTIKTPLGSTETMTYDSSGMELSDTQTLSSAGTAKSTYTYDASHRMLSASKVITSSLTDTASYTYNSAGELASSTMSGAGSTTYTYNTQKLLLTAKDSSGNITHYTYDPQGNRTGQWVTTSGGLTPQGKGPFYAFDEAGDKTLSVPAVGNNGSGSYVAADATTTTYNADGQETKVTAPGSAVTSTTYNPNGTVASSTDAGANKTTYTWTATAFTGGYTGETKKTVGPAGTTTDLYDPSGNVVSSTPPQPTKTTSGKPSGVVTNTYDKDGRIVAAVNGQGVRTTYGRNAAGDALSAVSRGVTRKATYNYVGWATATSTTTIAYGSNQSSTGGTSTPDTTTTSTTYDSAGDVLSRTDAAGGTTTYTYLAGDHVGTVTTKAGKTTYTYNALGDVMSVTTPAGTVTKYTYDALGRETAQTIGTQTWTIAYDADGNPLKTVDPDGRTATYKYDASNRKTNVAYSWASGHSGANAPPVVWDYNAMGERTAMIDGTNTYLYTYDTRGRLTKVQSTVNGCSVSCTTSTFSYDFSKPDEMIETYPDGAVVTDTTDDGGNLMGVSVPAQSDGSPAFKTASTVPNTLATQGSSTAASSGTASNATTALPPSGTLYPDGQIGYMFNEPVAGPGGSTTFASGQAFYTASMANSATGSQPDPPQAAYEAQADDHGNLLAENWNVLPNSSSTSASMHTLYGYNGGGAGQPVSEPSGSGTAGVRLTSYNGDYTMPGSDSIADGTYAYNGDGQPTSISASQGTTSSPTTVSWTLGYGSNGELNSVATTAPNPSNTPGSAGQYTYDAAGDLTAADVEPPYQTLTRAGVQYTFAYNDAGQLATATRAGGGDVINYGYNGDGTLVSENDTRGGSTVESINLTWDQRTASPELAEADFNGAFHQRYFWGNGVLGMEQSTSGAHNGTTYVFHDNQNGTPTMTTGTDGKTVAEYFTDPYGTYVDGLQNYASMGMLIGFQGSYADPLTGLDLMGSRWYDSDLGTFMSRPSATAPTPGASEVTSGGASTATEQMSPTPGTSPSMPVNGPATSYTFALADPTGEAQPTGNALAPAASGSAFSGTSSQNSIVGLYSTVKPYVSGPLAAILVNGAKLSVPLVSGELTQTAPAAVEATGGVETALSGTAAAEDGMLAAQAGNTAVEGTDAAKAGASTLGGLGEIGLGTIVSVGSFAASVYGTAQTCINYGAVSLQCAGAALGTVLSYGAQAICTAATAGAGTAVCGIVQSVIAAVVPLIVTGNGQAFLDSVTFSSGFNIGSAQVLAAQLAIAYVLGPLGAAALLGETIYANWSAIQNAFVYLGNAIASALETAGNAVLSAVEAAGGTIVSGISTAGEAVASGLSSFIGYLSSLGDTVLSSAFSNLGSNIASVVDSVGSALCDFITQIDCFFSTGSRAHGSTAGAGGGGARHPRAGGASSHAARAGGAFRSAAAAHALTSGAGVGAVGAPAGGGGSSGRAVTVPGSGLPSPGLGLPSPGLGLGLAG
jgi:YD repeat-containing protein